MEHPGRQSAADLSVVRVTAADRPQPPEHLTDAEASLWRSVTATKPADWFTDDSLPLLEAYVRAMSTHRMASEALSRYSPDMLADSDHRKAAKELGAIQSSAAASLAQLAMKMRLSQSARYGARGASGAHERTSKAAKKPWE